jgi:hypothetical protein
MEKWISEKSVCKRRSLLYGVWISALGCRISVARALRCGEHSASLLHGKNGGFESVRRVATHSFGRSLAVSSFRRMLPAAGLRARCPGFRLSAFEFWSRGSFAAGKVRRLFAAAAIRRVESPEQRHMKWRVPTFNSRLSTLNCLQYGPFPRAARGWRVPAFGSRLSPFGVKEYC